MSLKILIDRAFGHDGHEVRGEEILYFCPKCNHHKPKLSVNIDTGNWKCWVCGDTQNTKGKSIRTLFKLLQVPSHYYENLKKYKQYTGKVVESDLNQIIRLPDDFKSLTIPSIFPEYKQAIHYLKKRGITGRDIIKYNMGYCRRGDYANRIIIPSYTEDGQLNYFISRTWIKDHPLAYKNPPVSKNVVGFEMFINWSLPIYLVEGVFDSIAIRRNAIPLFGKTIPENLKLKLIENGVKDVYIILDNDAFPNLIKNTETLLKYGINVYAVRLMDKDPSDMGYNKIQSLIKQVKPLDFSDLLRMKLV